MKNDIFDQEPDMDSNMQNIQADAFTEAPQMVDYDPSNDAGDILIIDAISSSV